MKGGVDWRLVFDEVAKEEGASEGEIAAALAELARPLTHEEAEGVLSSQRNPFRPTDPLYEAWTPVDPAAWVLPAHAVPASYLDFLRWSNGGWARTGAREFGFFGTKDLRAMALAYHFPEHMPLAAPFALDGGGVFYVFDGRPSRSDGDAAVYAVQAGDLEWGAAAHVADSFASCCAGTVAVEALLYL